MKISGELCANNLMNSWFLLKRDKEQKDNSLILL